MKPELPPLWKCPKCGAKFKTFQKFKRMEESCGPATMIPQKTRVVFMVRMRFAGAQDEPESRPDPEA